MTAKISWKVNGGEWNSETRDLGRLPVMIRVSLQILSQNLFPKI